MRLNVTRLFLLLAAISPLSTAAAQERITLPAIADNSIVMVDGEWAENAGDKGRLRIKGNQHIVVMAFDLSAARGRTVRSAQLVCHKASDEVLAGVTISTVAVPWDEAGSSGLESQSGVGGWGAPGVLFPAVCGGNGNTLAYSALSRLEGDKYVWEVPPDLIHAMLLGAATGLAIHEHDADYSRNPAIFSKEQSGKRPQLLLELGGPDEAPPRISGPVSLRSTPDRPRAIQFTAPPHGFLYDVSLNGALIERARIPFVRQGELQTIELERAAVGGTAQSVLQRLSIVTVSRSGKRSEPFQFEWTEPPVPPLRALPAAIIRPAARDLLPGLCALPAQDRYDLAGRPIGQLPDDYRSNNFVFDGQTVRITAAAGEVAGFQVLVRGNGRRRIELTLGVTDWRSELSRAIYVRCGERLVPDPLVPFDGEAELQPTADLVLFADVYVPFDAQPQQVRGSLQISDGRTLPVELTVLPAALPRTASFICEMNSYGLPEHVDDYYALQQAAYDHRVHLNILHYSHRTAAPGARKSNLDMRLRSGRRMDNRRYDSVQPGDRTAYWDDFAEAFGPVLDGSHFAKGHRGAVPVPGFYLTFHESWPLNCRAHFNGNPDAELAFSESPNYAETFVSVLESFVQLAQQRNWTGTGFQVYLNNKGSLNDPERSPWVLDEPAGFWDYRALAWYGRLADRGRRNSAGITIDYRIDISRPEYARKQLDGRSDLWVVSGAAFRAYRTLVQEQQRRENLKVWIYGSASPVDESSRSIDVWVLDSWLGGATGVVPWQTLDKSGKALEQGDTLALFILDPTAGERPAVRTSLRLKGFLHAQQLVEKLILVGRKGRLSDAELAELLRGSLAAGLSVKKSNEEDAGLPLLENSSPRELDILRGRVDQLLRE